MDFMRMEKMEVYAQTVTEAARPALVPPINNAFLVKFKPDSYTETSANYTAFLITSIASPLLCAKIVQQDA